MSNAPPPQADADPHQLVRIITPPSEVPSLNLREAWQSRELIGVFVKRGIAVRYRQMALGIFWSFLEPLGLLLLTTIVFGLLIRVPTGDYPYAVFVFSALIPWLYFSKATNGAANSLGENIGIVSKVYFPRVLLPLSAVIREFIDSVVLFILLIGLAWVFGYPPTWRAVLMPLVFLYITVPALGVGMSIGSISIKFRDFRPMLSLALQAGFYTTPIFYPPELVPERFRPLYELNPMFWAVEATRWIIFSKPFVVTPSLLFSIMLSGVLLVMGLLIFSYYERGAVDAQ